MSDFFDELFEDVKTKPMTETVSVTVESTKESPSGERVRDVQEIKSEVNEVATPLMSKRTPYISVEMGTTINLGNYSNGKVKISFHMPVGIDMTPSLSEEIEKSFIFAKAWVEKKLDHETGELAKLRGKV